ncbi:putative n6-adenine methyltransferase domain-containing protein [Ditylenchus destructor]|uniref:Protein-lysine N-methyltransferase DdX_01387 n=1 Tax=Ditylenchus destructor TaxID=166010 RepID=A0AAD4NKG9_9BILA|nr:putative n6-adenine methyltransferase domain-containing protein [Ditylenchus destructor]
MATGTGVDEDGDESSFFSLPSDTLAALDEFWRDQQEKNDEFPEEDWQLSQFWYSDETSEALVTECLAALGNNGGNIACLSSPSLVPHFFNRKETQNEKVKITLLEFDQRFQEKFKDLFVHYDYREPLNIPAELHNSFDLIVADPPFLAEECLVKVAQTIRVLSRDKDTKLIICTGSILQDLANRLLKVNITNFKPQHRNNLANDFSSFTNYLPSTF